MISQGNRIPPKVIHQEKDFLVINKPAGWLVHGIKNQESGIRENILTEWLLKQYPEIKSVGDDPIWRPGIIHRLDKETSGVILIARNQVAFEYFKKQFQEHKIKKIYLTLVCGVPREKEGIIEKPIGLKSDSIKRTVHVQKAKMVKEAITKYKVKKIIDEKYSLLEVEPLTGRTHQIRVHLASIGHPVVGDKLYGQKKCELKIDRQFLHAESLELTAPDGRRLKFAVDLPDDLVNLPKISFTKW